MIRDLAAGVALSRRHVTHLLSTLAGYVYRSGEQGIPVSRERLLDLNLVERHDQGLRHLAPRTRQNARTRLRRLVRDRHGPLCPDHRTLATRDQTDPKQPNTSAEVDGFLGWAATRSTTIRRPAPISVCALSLGAGLAVEDLVHVRGTDVTTVPDGIARIAATGPRPRTAVLLRRYESVLVRLAADARDGWIANPAVPPASDSSRVYFGKQLPSAANQPTSGPRFTVTRCRVTWICHHLNAGTPLHVLTAATGVDPQALSRYGRYLNPMPDAERVKVLREA